MILTTALDSAAMIAAKRAGKPGSGFYAGRSRVMIERSFMAFKTSSWFIVLSGFFEPVFYLAAFGFGIGQLIGDVTDGAGAPVTYAAYIAPALLATSAMNGAIYDSTWNVFWKLNYGKVYQGVLSTSMGSLDVALGEIGWALLRGLVYALGFTAVVTPMGLIPSWWGVLAIPASVLIAFGFASFGMAITSYMKSFQQLNWVNFFMLPLFLFSGTFYPLDIYPEWLQSVIMALPLWQAVELVRSLTLGNVSMALMGNVLYFVVMVAVGLTFTTRRLTALFMR
jgi:lipooligosaccharide transport system permease protein